MTQLWRIHIRPTGPTDTVDVNESVNLCLKEGIIGIGWRVDKKPSSKEEYMRLGALKYGEGSWKSNADIILYEMKEDDLVWFRDTDGRYYLGRVVGDWEYRDEKKYLDADIVNVRPVDIIKVGTRVPGKIINSFIPSKTVQRILDQNALLFSQLLYNSCSSPVYPLSTSIGLSAIFDLLSAVDLEDVIGLYLQFEKSYVMIPSSRGRRDDTIRYEFELVNQDGRRACVQVKSGNVVINPDDYKNLATSKRKCFLFSPAGYTKMIHTNEMETLSTEEIIAFLKKYKDVLPSNIGLWVKYALSEGKSLRCDED